MFLAGSRYVTAWLNLSGPSGADLYNEGSPVDAAVFFSLIVAGIVILAKRDIDWKSVLGQNQLFVCYILYCLLSISWSDEPFIALKRWIKDLGNPIIVLVILTDLAPLRALGTVVRRLAFPLLPLSVLFIKYYPELGRDYRHDGSIMFTGVGQQKNTLGQLCLVIGIYYAWQVLHDREHFLTWTRARRIQLFVLGGVLVWLLYMSDSQTSLACLFVAVAVLASARLPFLRRSPARLVGLVVGGGLLMVSLEMAIGLKSTILELLGRDATLTDRTDVWAILLDLASNPFVGTGFMSFWAGDRMRVAWARVGAEFNQAHSGYIEQYLNLGYVGVAFIVILIARGLFAARSVAPGDKPWTALRVCFLVTAALYNYTEAAFYGINNMWVVLLLAILKLPTEVPTVRPTAKLVRV
jgi:O-antigen ligase